MVPILSGRIPFCVRRYTQLRRIRTAVCRQRVHQTWQRHKGHSRRKHWSPAPLDFPHLVHLRRCGMARLESIQPSGIGNLRAHGWTEREQANRTAGFRIITDNPVYQALAGPALRHTIPAMRFLRFSCSRDSLLRQ